MTFTKKFGQIFTNKTLVRFGILGLVYTLLYLVHISHRYPLPVSSTIDDTSSYDPLQSQQRQPPNSAKLNDFPSPPEGMKCREWLEQVDVFAGGRDFKRLPVIIHSSDNKRWDSCAVGCLHTSNPENQVFDATVGTISQGKESVLLSMESATNYPGTDVSIAHNQGYTIVMTTRLNSDVPVPYFSWAEYGFMEPIGKKTADHLAAAFISNCHAQNFRLGALDALQREGVTVDSYGACRHNMQSHGHDDKLETIKNYKFTLAFENSNELDYVTEKYFQALIAGSIPVVIGAPNILDFEPQENITLHITSLDEVPLIAERMKQIAKDERLFNSMFAWKQNGPQPKFLALVDLAVVHSACRLCLHVASKIQKKEAQSMGQDRPCVCHQDADGTDYHHIFIRERGKFEFVSLILESKQVRSITAFNYAIVDKFKSMKHMPIWVPERKDFLDSKANLRLYKVYPVLSTTRDHLYGEASIDSPIKLDRMLKSEKCPQLEVIFI
jgi:glycoprotein 3-alpha-L-fucosyltransferase